ncbi:hypothetical protein ACE6H2_006426 [Prunus campanulata]
MAVLSLSLSSLSSKDMRSLSLYDRSRASAPEFGRAPIVVEEMHPTDRGSKKCHQRAARKMGIILSSRESKLHMYICMYFLFSYLIRG